MATRARVGIQRDPDTVESIYVHWDGYPEHTGKILLEAWSDTGQLERLVALGDLSILGREIGEKHDFDTHDLRSLDCLAYGRDRGETGVASETHPFAEWPDSGHEYEYLWDGSCWSYRGYPVAYSTWEPLDRKAVAS